MKLWSITTTIRNPERVPGLIEICLEFDGKSFSKNDKKEKDRFQANFFIRQFQKKLYGYGKSQFLNSLSNKHKKLIEDSEKNNSQLSFQDAEEILMSKKYTGGIEMRGRQVYNLIKKFSLCYFDSWSNKERVFFRVHPNAIKLKSNKNLLFRHCLLQSYQYPLDINDSDFKLIDGYDVKPLITTFEIIDKVNKLSKELGQKEVGITRKEFEIYVMSIINYKQIDQRVNMIIEFRNKIKSVLNKDLNKFYFESFKDCNGQNFEYKNDKDYSDNVLRYFLETEYFIEKRYGVNHYINLNPDYIEEIKKYSKILSPAAVITESEEKRVAYFNDVHDNILNKNLLLEDIKILIESYPNLYQKPIENLDSIELFELKENLIKKLKMNKLNEIKNSILQNKDFELNKVINRLEDDLQKITPEELEYLTSIALICVCDKDSMIIPNYKADIDGYPKSHAKAGSPDIECYLNKFNLICEVTKLNGRNQWYMESVPIQRHLSIFSIENNDKDSYCIFIAPKIHDDGLWAIWCSVKYGYLENQYQKIIPLSFSDFIILLRHVNRSNSSENCLQNFLDNCLRIDSITNFEDWRTLIKDSIREIESNI